MRTAKEDRELFYLSFPLQIIMYSKPRSSQDEGISAQVSFSLLDCNTTKSIRHSHESKKITTSSSSPFGLTIDLSASWTIQMGQRPWSWSWLVFHDIYVSSKILLVFKEQNTNNIVCCYKISISHIIGNIYNKIISLYSKESACMARQIS